VSYYPVSIPAHSMALNVTVQSYNGRLDYGLIACRRAMPDVNQLADDLLAEHRLLFELAQARMPAPVLAQAVAAPQLPSVKLVSVKAKVKPAKATSPKRPPAKVPRRRAAKSIVAAA
jgi:diacylglycerol O-acyltransferase